MPFGLDGGDHLGLHFGVLGLTWVIAWKALVPFGIHWVGQGAQMSYLALLCRREHQFKGPGGGGGLNLCRPVASDSAGLWPLKKNS